MRAVLIDAGMFLVRLPVEMIADHVSARPARLNCADPGAAPVTAVLAIRQSWPRGARP